MSAIVAGQIPHAFVRYYQVPPEEKSLEQCESHGRDHAAYQWNLQIDPRWSEEQRAAYVSGYNPSTQQPETCPNH